jgi:hypothetical protein
VRTYLTRSTRTTKHGYGETRKNIVSLVAIRKKNCILNFEYWQVVALGMRLSTNREWLAKKIRPES